MGEAMSKIKVWDLPVRVMHWGLAFAVLGSWLTQELEGDWFAWHTRFGYAVLVLAVTRLAWGFVGTQHARFADFVRGPRAVITYVLSWRDRSGANAHVGHNPLGAWAIVLMLAMLLAQALTGLFANDQIFQTGPLFGYVTAATSDFLTTVHKQLFDALSIVIGIHILAAFVYLLYRKENLIMPMITGNKTVGDAGARGIESSRLWLAVAILSAVSAALAWVVSTAPEAYLFTF